MLSRQLVAYLQATARPAKLHTHTRPTPTHVNFHDDFYADPHTDSHAALPHVQAGLQPACILLRVCNPLTHVNFHADSHADPHADSHVQAGLQPACILLRVCNPRCALFSLLPRVTDPATGAGGLQTRQNVGETWEKRGRNVETRSPTLASTFTHVNLHVDFHVKPGRLSIKIART